MCTEGQIHACASSECAYPSHAPLKMPDGLFSVLCRVMLEREGKDGHRGVFELLHLSEKGSGASVAALFPREFPLFYGGKELKPFQYGLFLLSKVS